MAFQATSTTTITQTPPTTTLPKTRPAPVAVVVGAGPAGIATASALANRGWKVEVFERRDEQVSAPTKSQRGYPMVLNGRALATLEMAGLSRECTGATIPQEGVVFNGRAFAMKGSKTGSLSNSYIVDRLSLSRGMYAMASSEAHPGSANIGWHWGQALDNVDWERRCAVFKAGSGSSSSGGGGEQDEVVRTAVEYDLLVGADGYQSAVRQSLQEQQVLTTDLLAASKATYKTFHDLQLSQEAEELLPGITTHAPCQYVYFIHTPGAPNVTMWKADDNTVSGMVSGAKGYEKETLQEALSKALSKAPTWRSSIIAQTCDGAQPPSPFGQVLKVSQLHGPSCVLLGDAAHPVTSTLGQGCNLALESVRVFVSTLDRVGLEAAPKAFTEARLPDAHAFQTLEFNQVVHASKQPIFIKGQTRLPSGFEKFASALMMQPALLLGPLLRLLLPGLDKKLSLSMAMLRDAQVPYRKVLAVLQLQAGLRITTGLAALVAAVGLAAKLAAGVMA